MPIEKVCSNSLSPPSPLVSGGFGGPIESGGKAAAGWNLSSEPSDSAPVALLIPAFRPSRDLVELVRAFTADPGWESIVVVDDGSGPEYDSIFAQLLSAPLVRILRHAVNLGKGAALKSGINAILCSHPGIAGVVTADADGQHHPSDAADLRTRFQRDPDALVLGVRSFGGAIPFRSKFGNRITKVVMRTVLGQRIGDSQTGLRAIPRSLLLKLLRVPAAGYEFESEMLVAVKHLGVPVIEQPIRTIYEPGNPSSHFRPLWDSARIYAVLLRFGFISMLTAVLDNTVFYFLFGATGSIAISQIVARAAAVVFNYSTVRKAVFLSEERHRILLPRYLLVVLVNGLLSYAGISLLMRSTALAAMPAKIFTEAALFIANFIAQRDFVFSRRLAHGATDWDNYYKRVPFFARFTRKYTQSALISALRACSFSSEKSIVEIGGANSCFLDGLTKALRPKAYHIVDLNRHGLSLLERRAAVQSDVVLHHGDILSMPDLGTRFDVAMSVGLVEHFDVRGTGRAVAAHFDCLKEGGHAVISFPTPTWLYRTARFLAEAVGAWNFPDERPLEPAEVRGAVIAHGEIVHEKTLWPLILTQHLIVVRKEGRIPAALD